MSPTYRYAVSITTTGGRRRYLGHFLGKAAWRRNRRRATLFADPSTARQAARAQARSAPQLAQAIVHAVTAGGRWHAQGSYGSITRTHLPDTGFGLRITPQTEED